jgi:16S rRNA (guanine966-N2)-methyltransferase
VGEATRPMTDRVKQSLFDIVTPLLEGARVYDCFSGTGSMGLECLSRGAGHATFFDADKPALVGLKKNIEMLKVGDRARVVAGDLFAWMGSPANFPKAGEHVHLLFLDPPYRYLRERPGELVQLADTIARHYLTPDGTVVFRHDAGDELLLPALPVADVRTYGGMTLEFLTPVPPEEEGPRD